MVVDGNNTGGAQRFWRLGTNGSGVCGLTIGNSYTFSYWIKSVSTSVTDVASRSDIGIQINNATAIVPATTTDLAPMPIDGWKK